MGLVRYSLTVHFQDNGLLHELWQCAPNRVLLKCAARATGEIYRPSVETEDNYLRRYFDGQSLRILDPTDALPDGPNPRARVVTRGIDLVKEFDKQRTNPIRSNRWRIMRQTVLERDQRTCQVCGYSGDGVEIDHVKPRHSHPELVWEMSNIQTICKPCHIRKNVTDHRAWRETGNA